MAVATFATSALVLCVRGTLGKGTLRMYPSFRVPTHPFRALGHAARGKYRGEFSICKYQGRTAYDGHLCGVCFGSLLGSPVQGAS